MRPLLSLLIGVSVLSWAGAHADIVTYGACIEFSGNDARPPEGTPPWLTATFNDHGTPGSVDLLLEATNLTDSEHVKQWLFNLDPALDPNDLVFSEPIVTGTFTDPIIDTIANAFMANGDGYFDIQVGFDEADGGDRRFGVGETAQYTITGILTLTASSFDFLSYCDGGQGQYPMAAHVGGIGPDDECSDWVSVAEPGAVSLLVVGALIAVRRRR
jgi:MYXO-CTERM domain-containing protein